jgi:dihydroflavonol-4-reductase
MPTKPDPDAPPRRTTGDPFNGPGRVFLTGATGFIGRPLVEALLRRGYVVHALVRSPQAAPARELAAAGVRIFAGDVTRPETLRAGMEGVGAVIHNAAWFAFGIRRRDAAKMHATNVGGTRHTLDAALAAGVGRIVHVSSILEFGHTDGAVADETFRRRSPPRTVYEQTKSEAHAYATELQARGAPIVVACPGAVFGPGDVSVTGMLQRMYVRGLLPPLELGTAGRIGRIHVSDVVEGLVRCLERGASGETYILSAGAIRHADLFALWRRSPGGARRTWWTVPDRLTRPLCGLVGLVERPFHEPVLFSREMAATVTAAYAVSGAKAERELGLRYRDMEEAWRETLAHERAAARPRHRGAEVSPSPDAA